MTPAPYVGVSNSQDKRVNITYIRSRRVYILHIPHQGNDSFRTDTSQVISTGSAGHSYDLEVAANDWESSFQLEKKMFE